LFGSVSAAVRLPDRIEDHQLRAQCAKDTVRHHDGDATTSIVFLPPSTGTFFVKVEDAFGASGQDFTYVLRKR
jgi:hypothetical protein